MSNGTIRDDALDPFLIKMGLLGNPETMPATHVQQRGMPRTSAASLGISEDIFETFGDIKEMIRKGLGDFKIRCKDNDILIYSFHLKIL